MHWKPSLSCRLSVLPACLAAPAVRCSHHPWLSSGERLLRQHRGSHQALPVPERLAGHDRRLMRNGKLPLLKVLHLTVVVLAGRQNLTLHELKFSFVLSLLQCVALAKYGCGTSSNCCNGDKCSKDTLAAALGTCDSVSGQACGCYATCQCIRCSCEGGLSTDGSTSTAHADCARSPRTLLHILRTASSSSQCIAASKFGCAAKDDCCQQPSSLACQKNALADATGLCNSVSIHTAGGTWGRWCYRAACISHSMLVQKPRGPCFMTSAWPLPSAHLPDRSALMLGRRAALLLRSAAAAASAKKTLPRQPPAPAQR